jgi:hypothetical protein
MRQCGRVRLEGDWKFHDELDFWGKTVGPLMMIASGMWIVGYGLLFIPRSVRGKATLIPFKDWPSKYRIQVVHVPTTKKSYVRCTIFTTPFIELHLPKRGRKLQGELQQLVPNAQSTSAIVPMPVYKLPQQLQMPGYFLSPEQQAAEVYLHQRQPVQQYSKGAAQTDMGEEYHIMANRQRTGESYAFEVPSLGYELGHHQMAPSVSLYAGTDV